jgi:hypothetical protein
MAMNAADLFRKNARGEIPCDELIRLLVGDSKYAEKWAHICETKIPTGSKVGSEDEDIVQHGSDEETSVPAANHQEICQAQAEPEVELIEDVDHAAAGQGNHHDLEEGTKDVGEAEKETPDVVGTGDPEEALVEDDTFRDMRGLDVAFPESGRPFSFENSVGVFANKQLPSMQCSLGGISFAG